MTPKRSRRPASDNVKPTLNLLPAPRCSPEVVMLLQHAARLRLANSKTAAHLAEMAELYPKEMIEAYRIFRAGLTSDN